MIRTKPILIALLVSAALQLGAAVPACAQDRLKADFSYNHSLTFRLRKTL